MFKVAHMNGREIHSEYYIDERNIPTLEEAKEKARQFRAENPESDGWYYIVAVLDEDNTSVWSPDIHDTPSQRARPIREVEETTGVAARTIRRWAAAGQIWAEQRYGKLWYVDPDDVQRVAAETGEGARRGWPLGKARK